MPLEKTFWAARFGMVVDRFGIPWLINCDGSVVGFFEPDHKWTLEGLTNPELNELLADPWQPFWDTHPGDLVIANVAHSLLLDSPAGELGPSLANGPLETRRCDMQASL
jgi:hypothetical protein